MKHGDFQIIFPNGNRARVSNVRVSGVETTFDLQPPPPVEYLGRRAFPDLTVETTCEADVDWSVLIPGMTEAKDWLRRALLAEFPDGIIREDLSGRAMEILRTITAPDSMEKSGLSTDARDVLSTARQHWFAGDDKKGVEP